jgi:hypothetical protein
MIRLLSGAALALSLLAFSGCKQGEGGVCQVHGDCEDGLRCNASTRRCQSSGETPSIDAAPGPDARQVDADVDVDAGD